MRHLRLELIRLPVLALLIRIADRRIPFALAVGAVSVRARSLVLWAFFATVQRRRQLEQLELLRLRVALALADAVARAAGHHVHTAVFELARNAAFLCWRLDRVGELLRVPKRWVARAPRAAARARARFCLRAEFLAGRPALLLVTAVEQALAGLDVNPVRKPLLLLARLAVRPVLGLEKSRAAEVSSVRVHLSHKRRRVRHTVPGGPAACDGEGGWKGVGSPPSVWAKA